MYLFISNAAPGCEEAKFTTIDMQKAGSLSDLLLFIQGKHGEYLKFSGLNEHLDQTLSSFCFHLLSISHFLFLSFSFFLSLTTFPWKTTVQHWLETS